MICPNCHEEAPTIVRGVRAYCTACGAPRSLLSDTPVNVAGQPSKIGGAFAKVFGWIVLLTGMMIGLAIIGIGAAFGYTTIGLALGALPFTLSLLYGLFLIIAGRQLQKSGIATERSKHESAVFALARQRGGSVTPAELARAISISEATADALLTEMAKRPGGHVTLEVDDDGTLRYEVHEGGRVRVQGAPRVRVAGGQGAPAGNAEEAEHLAEAEMAAEEEARRKERMRR